MLLIYIIFFAHCAIQKVYRKNKFSDKAKTLTKKKEAFTKKTSL